MLANVMRPRKLQDVIGQEKVVKAINNYLKEDINGFTCLALTGASGCGKNSIANIVASILQSEHPIINGEWIEPDFSDPAVKDIVDEKFQRDVHVYSGNNVTAEVLRNEIEDFIQYAPNDKNCIVIINEAQTCSCLRRLLEIIETPRKNVVWILTSTDTKKFSANTFSKDNKVQEASALRSRCAYFNILPITESEIARVIWNYADKCCEDGKQIPDSFFDDGIPQFIAKNSVHNLRRAINDIETIINAECWTKEDIISLLGYSDEVAEYEMVVKLCNKDTSVMDYLRDNNDLEGFYIYVRKIVAESCMRMISKVPYEEDWKEKSYQNMAKSGNLLKLGDFLSDMAKFPYFNDGIFMVALSKFYMDNSNNKGFTSIPIPTRSPIATRTPIHG